MVLENKTICECFKKQVKIAPDNIALEYNNEMFSWNELDLISDQVAVSLKKRGIKKGSHVGLWSANTPNWIISFFAINKLGAVTILINTFYKEIELSRVIEYADIEFLCYGDGYGDSSYEKVLKNISQELLDKRKRIAIGRSDDGKWDGLKEKEKDITKEEAVELLRISEGISAHETAAILFTSGTSKIPKGVRLSHYNLIKNSFQIASSMRWMNNDKMCVAVPLYHCFGVTASLLVAVHTGCSIHLLENNRTISILEKVEKYKCTILNGVPSMFLVMLHNEKHKEYDISSINSGIIAGSHISSIDYLKICEMFHIAHLQPSYGQTEASPCITIAAYDDSLEMKANTVGKPIPDIKVRIYDKENGKELQTGEIGEIQTSGYHVMKGYYKMPEETKSAIMDGVWLCTGDLGYLDDSGYLHVTGRMTEMIIRGGENISPAEIEGAICGYPNIKNIKVVGVKADILQEDIVACIVTADGKEIDIDSLKNFIKEKLSDYKLPKYILHFEKLPYNSSGKVILNDLKQQALDMIDVIKRRRNY